MFACPAHRCIAICHSLRSQKMSRRALAGLVGGIWAASAAVAAPNLLAYEYCPLLASNGPTQLTDMSAEDRELLGLRTCPAREHLLLVGVSFRAYLLFVFVFNYVVCTSVARRTESRVRGGGVRDYRQRITLSLS